MDIRKEKVCGAEALVRWNYKHKEMLAPYRFIPYFEADDSIIKVDDFGTGYSSFALLKEMPLGTLKIDKSFVDLIVADEDTEKITIILRHIISMAKELGIDSIAEGVEEQTQVKALHGWGCEMVQGYYYSKPLPIGEFEEKYLG